MQKKKWQKSKVEAEFEIAYIQIYTHYIKMKQSLPRWVEIAALLIL